LHTFEVSEKQAWDSIGTTFEDTRPHESEGVVPANGTTVPPLKKVCVYAHPHFLEAEGVLLCSHPASRYYWCSSSQRYVVQNTLSTLISCSLVELYHRLHTPAENRGISGKASVLDGLHGHGRIIANRAIVLFNPSRDAQTI
jgi:hypothetical protein